MTVIEAGNTVYVVIGDDGGPFEPEPYLAGVHVSKHEAEIAREALDEKYATVEEIELRP